MKTNNVLIGLLIPIAMLFTQGCGKVKFSSSFKPDDKVVTQTQPPQVTPCEENPTDCGEEQPEDCEGCYLQLHRQKDETTKVLDLVFVTDTSGSLDVERAAVAEGVKNFVAKLPPGVQYNIAVILAHGSKSAYSGKLYQTDSLEPVVLKSNELSLTEIQTHLKKKLTSVKNDGYSDGGELGLFSLSQGIKGANLSTAQSQGIFRSNAGLAIVFISDENDVCFRYPAGITPIPDPDNGEAPAFARDCGSTTYQSVHTELKNLKGSMPLSVNGIIYTGQGAFESGPSTENEIGYGYKEIIELTNGVKVDMAGNNIANDLAVIGQGTANTLMVDTAFELAVDGSLIDTTSLWIEVDGVRVNHMYVLSTNTIHIRDASKAGGPGSKIVIHYCLKDEEEEEEPCHVCTGGGNPDDQF